MAGGKKPDTRVVVKSKSTGKTVLTLASYWTQDGPMPSGGLDRSIQRILIERIDQEGNLHKEVIDNRKDSQTHYVNLQIWKDDDQRSAPPQRQQTARKPAADLPPDTFDDSDIPF